MGKKVHHLILGCILDATEYVTKILIRVYVVCLAICKDRQCPGKPDPSIWATDEETVITVLRQSAYFSLDAIIGKVQCAVLQTMQQTGIFLQGILHSLDQFGFFLRVKFLFKYVEFIFDTLQYRTYLQDSLLRDLVKVILQS